MRFGDYLKTIQSREGKRLYFKLLYCQYLYVYWSNRFLLSRLLENTFISNIVCVQICAKLKKKQ